MADQLLFFLKEHELHELSFDEGLTQELVNEIDDVLKINLGVDPEETERASYIKIHELLRSLIAVSFILFFYFWYNVNFVLVCLTD